VRAFSPASEAPHTAEMLAISSSIWMKEPPTSGRRRASTSAISVDGVMGIAREEARAGGDGALGHCLVALHQHAHRMCHDASSPEKSDGRRACTSMAKSGQCLFAEAARSAVAKWATTGLPSASASNTALGQKAMQDTARFAQIPVYGDGVCTSRSARPLALLLLTRLRHVALCHMLLDRRPAIRLCIYSMRAQAWAQTLPSLLGSQGRVAERGTPKDEGTAMGEVGDLRPTRGAGRQKRRVMSTALAAGSRTRSPIATLSS